MLGSRVKLNHHTVQEYLDGEHGVEAMLERRAEKVLAAARQNAPVLSGDYKASLQVVTTHTDRMVKRISSDRDYALLVEARDGVLARALDAAGGA